MKKRKISTIDMEVALIKHFNVRRNLIVPNVSWGITDEKYKPLHECDLIVLSNSGYATEIEIKVSRHDLLKDKEKRHGHSSKLIKHLYFAVPEYLQCVALDEIPSGAGLLVLHRVYNDFSGELYDYMSEIKQPSYNVGCVRWDETQRYKLARLGTMRILGLKKKIAKLIMDKNEKEASNK